MLGDMLVTLYVAFHGLYRVVRVCVGPVGVERHTTTYMLRPDILRKEGGSCILRCLSMRSPRLPEDGAIQVAFLEARKNVLDMGKVSYRRILDRIYAGFHHLVSDNDVGSGGPDRTDLLAP